MGDIADALGVSKGTITKYLLVLQLKGLIVPEVHETRTIKKSVTLWSMDPRKEAPKASRRRS